jgi:hypothetical protein
MCDVKHYLIFFDADFKANFVFVSRIGNSSGKGLDAAVDM